MRLCAGSSIKTRAAKTFYSLIKTPGSVLVLREVLSEEWTLPKLSAVIKDASYLLHKTVTAQKKIHGVLKCTVVYFLLCWYQDIRIWELRQAINLYSISVQKRLLKQIYNLSVTKIRFNKRKTIIWSMSELYTYFYVKARLQNINTFSNIKKLRMSLLQLL